MGSINKLLEVMAQLRDPQNGCPWDVQQTFSTIAPYTVEEAYEVADAIERDSLPDLKDELGDLLFQVVFHARMAEEKGAFVFDDVVESICSKMTRRHPHVFGTTSVADAQAQTLAWEEHKAAERAEREGGLLDDIPVALPALMRSSKLTRRAARVGFDWPDLAGVKDKVDEELAELDAAIGQGDATAIEEEMGDALFAMANLARHLEVDPEAALHGCCAKFLRRFASIETELAARGATLEDASLETMDQLWNEAKKAGA